MKTSLKTYLAFSYLAVVLIGIGLAAALTWLAVERIYVNTQADNLLAQAQLIAAAIQGEPLPAVDPVPYSQLSNVMTGIHTRVLDAQGAAIIDLSAPGQPNSAAGLALPQLAQNATGLVTPEELMARPEIVEASYGHAATAVRQVEAAGGLPVLYAAAPVLSSEGQVIQIIYLAMPLPNTQWSALPPSVRWQFLAILMGAILLASGAGLLFARRITRPLGQLAETVQVISTGDLSQAAPEDPSLAELTLLSQAFNRMIHSLRQADKAKNSFIAGVTHELRTPLTVIKGTIETLQDGAVDDMDARGPFLESMGQETERLIRIVNDLLILTRADAGELNLQLKKLDLEDLARSRCTQLEQLACQSKVRLIVDPSSLQAGECANILADSDRITQILDNLLANAIRYTPENCEVRVTLAKEGNQIACRVIDTGPGIPAQHLPFIFDRFYRVDPARGRNQGGSGLGLAIVQELVESQGGKVAASSQEGQGTTITFWLQAFPN